MNTEEGTYAVKKYIPDDEPLIEGSDQIAYNPDDSGREEYKFKLGIWQEMVLQVPDGIPIICFT